MIKFTDKLSIWVIDILLSQPTVELRASTLVHFIKVAKASLQLFLSGTCISSDLLILNHTSTQELAALYNYSAMVAILTGFGMPPIYRLKKTKSYVTEKLKDDKVFKKKITVKQHLLF